MHAPWYKSAIFYQVYPRAFYDTNADGFGDLPGITSKLDYLKWLGVDCVWLMPIYPSPLRDDGYDIADYTGVLPEYGTLADFKALIEAAHARGIRVIADLVLNHTSDQHPWFQAARASRSSPYRDFYVWSDSDQKYAGTRIIFLDTEKSNWTWDPVAGQYFWHRFYSTQPDLNYDNPEVQQTMIEVLKFWMELGIDGFRADAIPYLFEREGTSSENLPETHAYLKKVRAYLNEHYPDAILLGEANQWPEDVRPYFGEGTDELHMNFHFPVMPRLFMALRKADRTPIQWIMEKTPPVPEQVQWVTFLRNHDELTLEMVTPEEREWMWKEYAPDARMRLNLGIRRRLAPLLDNDQRKIRLAYSLLFTLPGTPIIYYGDEIGMGDNIELFDRNGVRTPMQWKDSVNAGFSEADPDRLYAPVISQPPYDPSTVNVEKERGEPGSLLNFIRRLNGLRKELPVLSLGSLRWLEIPQVQVLGFAREMEGQRAWLLHNLSPETQAVSLHEHLPASLKDLLSGLDVHASPSGELNIVLQPYQSAWLVEKRGTEPGEGSSN